MRSSNGNFFCITGPLCVEFTGHWWIPLTKASDVELWCFLLICAWTNGLENNCDVGDLRCHCTHYDVTVMYMLMTGIFPGTVVVNPLSACSVYKCDLNLVITSPAECLGPNGARPSASTGLTEKLYMLFSLFHWLDVHDISIWWWTLLCFSHIHADHWFKLCLMCAKENLPKMLTRTRPISQIPQRIRQISHNTPFCNRNCTFCYKMVHCGIWDWCIVEFAQQVNWKLDAK